MGMTTHERAVRWSLRNWLNTPDGVDALRVYLNGLDEGRWPSDYLNAVGQIHGLDPEDWPYEQIVAFAYVNTYINSGRAARVLVQTLDVPSSDKDREANQAALSSLLGPFTAHVDPQQNSGNDDGWLAWDEPIMVEQSIGKAEVGDDGDLEPITRAMWAPPGKIPLEIGTSKPSRTFHHLSREGGVARWPYGQDMLHVFIETSRFALTPASEEESRQGSKVGGLCAPLPHDDRTET